MKKIYETIDNKQENLRLKQEKRNKIALKLNKYIQLLKDYIEDNLIDKNTKTLKRNLKDNNMDISVIGAVYPFNVFNPNEKVFIVIIIFVSSVCEGGGCSGFGNGNYCRRCLFGSGRRYHRVVRSCYLCRKCHDR